MRRNELNKTINVGTIAGISMALIAMILIPATIYSVTYARLTPHGYEKRVCAFYYTWYHNQTAYYGEAPGTETLLLHWDESHPDLDPPIVHDPTSDPWDIAAAQHPSLGTDDVVLFDSADPAAIRFHLQMAQYAGIDTFIATWWGRGGYEDYTFRQLLNITELDGYDMQHTVYFETVQSKYYHNNTQCVNNLYTDLKYIIENYGNHSKFLKIHDDTMDIDRPVIFIYSTTARPSVLNWTQAINMLHDDGLYPFLIADIGSPGAIRGDYLPIFDGFHVYNPLGLYVNYPENAYRDFESLVLSARREDKLSCTTVLPGYNDSQVRHGTPILKRDGGNTYRKSWDVALKSGADWTLICTFNEWHEGTEIEPSIENGTFYVNLTREYTTLFKG